MSGGLLGVWWIAGKDNWGGKVETYDISGWLESMGDSEVEVQEQLNQWVRVVAQYGMKLNAGKCEYMVMTRI